MVGLDRHFLPDLLRLLCDPTNDGFDLLRVVAPKEAAEEDPRVLRMLRGAAKGVSHEEYGRHLQRKYR
jgi:hypothetical protein